MTDPVFQEPTGREPFTSVLINETSATERAKFRKCRRDWLLSTVHRLGSAEGNVNFLFGTAVHAALAQGYTDMASKVGKVVIQSSLGAFRESWDSALEDLADFLGFLWHNVSGTYDEMTQLGEDMVRNYWAYDAEHPLVNAILSVEERFFVPIMSPSGSVVGQLSCQMDLVGEDDHGAKITDHKTASQAPNPAQLDFDDQLRAYIWARWKHTGEWVRRAVYNALLKKSPHQPKRLKPGKDLKVKLSQDRSQLTTYDLYLAAIDEEGLDRNDYAEILMYFRDESPQLVIREGLYMSKGSLTEFERNLYHEFADMRRVALKPELAYPNPSPFNCPSCPVKTACLAMMNGEDVESVIKNEYVVLQPRW